MTNMVDRQLDLRGGTTVAPVVLAQGMARCLLPGQILVVRCDRAATCRDVRAWAMAAGLEVLARKGAIADCRLHLRRPLPAVASSGRGA